MGKSNKRLLMISVGIIIILISVIVLIDSRVITNVDLDRQDLGEIIEKENNEKLEVYKSKEEKLTTDEKLEYGLRLSRNQEYNKAEEIYLEVLKAEPNNYLAIHRLGNLAIEVNDFKKALDYREQNAQLYPEDSDTYYYYSQLLLLHDIEKANEMAHKMYEVADEENENFSKIYKDMIENIHSGNVIGYENLFTNDEIFIPDNLKLAIIESVKEKTEHHISDKLLEIEESLKKNNE